MIKVAIAFVVILLVMIGYAVGYNEGVLHEDNDPMHCDQRTR
jgi:hypothetical protein